MRKLNTLIFILALISYSIGCQETGVNKKYDRTIQSPNFKGQELVTTNCLACHDPKAGMENRIAPPLIAIKKHFMDEETNQEEFTLDLIKFMNDPSKETSKISIWPMI